MQGRHKQRPAPRPQRHSAMDRLEAALSATRLLEREDSDPESRVALGLRLTGLLASRESTEPLSWLRGWCFNKTAEAVGAAHREPAIDPSQIGEQHITDVDALQSQDAELRRLLSGDAGASSLYPEAKGELILHPAPVRSHERDSKQDPWPAPKENREPVRTNSMSHSPPRARPSKRFRRWQGDGGSSSSSFHSISRKAPKSREEEEQQPDDPSPFMSAAEKYQIDRANKRKGARRGTGSGGSGGSGLYRNKKSRKRRTSRKGFKPPSRIGEDSSSDSNPQVDPVNASGAPSFVKKALRPPRSKKCSGKSGGETEEAELPEELKGLDPKLVEAITNEMMDRNPGVRWADIAGLSFAKRCVQEIVVWPMLRPDLFKGLRGPPKGLLLFGPPGTGKTLIGKAIASESKARFFSISASSLTSKWHGEGEKLVRTLFAVARYNQPSVIFVDEIDSLLSQRTEGEFEASRRVKTEFLVQLDGAATDTGDRVLLVGATNRPQELDEAARRRMVKRLYIPLPDAGARKELLLRLLATERHAMGDGQIASVVGRTDGYSGADLKALATEAAMGPMREIHDIQSVSESSVRPIGPTDFEDGLKQVRASVHKSELEQYIKWNRMYGSFA